MQIERTSKTCYCPIYPSAHKRFKLFVFNCLETLPQTIYTTWESVKARFSVRSETDLYLENLEKNTSVDWEKEIDKISECIAKASPYTPTGIRLKKCIATCPEEKLPELLNKALDYLFASEKGSLDSFYKLLDDKLLEKKFGSTSDLIKELSLCLPPVRTPPIPSFWSRLGKILSVVSRFFPRFMDILLKAFNLIEVGKGPETPWDFYAILSIYFKLFMIPYALFLSITAIVSVPGQAILLTAAALLLIVTGICIYIRYRPVPREIPRAKNLSEKVAQAPSNWIGREDLVLQLLSSIGAKGQSPCTHVLIKGEKGLGKTALVEETVRRCKEKTFFRINTPRFVEGFTPLDDKLGLLQLDLKGHEREVVLIFEEFGDAIKNGQKNLGGCLKEFMDSEQVQVIALTTEEEYSSIKDTPLDDRFEEKIELQSLQKEDIVKIIQKRISNEANDLLFDKDVAIEIYNKTQDNPKPRAAIKLVKKAVKKVRFNLQNRPPEELVKKKESLEILQSEYRQNSSSEQRLPIKCDIEKLEKEITTLEEKQNSRKQAIISFEKLLRWRKDANQQRDKILEGQEKHPLFVHHVFLPWIQKKIEQLGEKMQDIQYKVDAELIKTL